MPEDFRAVVKRLAESKGTSVAAVGYDAYDREVKGTNPDTFKSVMAGRRKPTRVLMEAVAAALDEPPSVFLEYRLAVARAALDENGPEGLDGAARHLEALETVISLAPGMGKAGSAVERLGRPSDPELTAAAVRLAQELLAAGRATGRGSASSPAVVPGRGHPDPAAGDGAA